jgi:SAM-dependent methyltransferase
VREWIVTYWPLVTQIVLGGLLLACAWVYLPLLWGALWRPTPRRIVDKMLRAAGVQPGHKVVDLGAGDGRIVIAAARAFQARAVGVEIDPLRCLIANARIRLLGLQGQAHVYCGNLFEYDLADADVVTLYLWPRTNQRLKPRLAEQLRPGARVVSYKFLLDGWTSVETSDPGGEGILVYEIGQTGPDWAALMREDPEDKRAV